MMLKIKLFLIITVLFEFSVYGQNPVNHGMMIISKESKSVKSSTVVFDDNAPNGYRRTSMPGISVKYTYSIDGVEKGSIGRRGKNLKAYLESCSDANEYFSKMQRQRKTEPYFKYSGYILTLAGGALFQLENVPHRQVVGGGVAALGITLLVKGFFNEIRAEKNLYKAAKSYNNCKGYNAAHPAIQWTKPEIGLATTSTINGKYNTGIKIAWQIEK